MHRCSSILPANWRIISKDVIWEDIIRIVSISPYWQKNFLRAEVDFDMSKRKFVDVQTIFHKMEQRTLSAAYHFYCDKCLEDAHTAAADTMATYEVLMAQLDRYGEKLEK